VTAVAFRRVEGVVVSYLNGALAEPVSTKVPPSRPTAFVTVQRVGGDVVGRVVDRPRVSVSAWGDSFASALELAEDVRDALLDGARRATAGFHRVKVESLYYDPDPVSSQDRYTLLVSLTVRANRA
jgi:hypothetical protein